MEIIGAAIAEALRLITTWDEEVAGIAELSVKISVSAVVLATIIGLPAGAALAWGTFRGRRVLLAAANTLMGLPPVVAGLLILMLLWRGGPLAGLQWLYEPEAMVLAQTLIALPIIVALAASAYQQLNPQLRWQLLALGASRAQVWRLLTREARKPLLTAVMAGLGRVTAEVGAALIVGGNIRGSTRVLTTAMVLESQRGDFPRALALAIILMLIAFAISGVLTYLQQAGTVRWMGQ